MYPAFAVVGIAFFLIAIRWAFGSNRSGLIGGEMLTGLLFILLGGAPLTLIWFAVLRAAQKISGAELSGGPFFISFVVVGCLQWIIWSQLLALAISTFLFSY